MPFIVRHDYTLVRLGDGSDNQIQVPSWVSCGASFRHKASPDQCRFLVK